MLHGPNLGGLCCIRWCDPLRWVSFTGVLCGGLCVGGVCLFCVSVVREGVCSIFGVRGFAGSQACWIKKQDYCEYNCVLVFWLLFW